MPPVLDRVLATGELRVLTRNSPSVYYEGPDGPTGFEYDLAQEFAERLGVELKLVVPEQFSSIIDGVHQAHAHFAAAGLSVTDERRKSLRFAPPVLEVTQQVVYKGGGKRPRRFAELAERQIEVLGGSSHAERLRELQREYPDLKWLENVETDTETLLDRVAKGELDLTVADSNDLSINQRYQPMLRAAFDLTEPQSTAWAFPKNTDPSLYNKAVEFIINIEQEGLLDEIRARHFAHVERLDYTGALSFASLVKNRLPKYQMLFEKAANKFGFDWRLLAAVGYQESHWNPDARSPTGVRGLMMLTNRTAKEQGVKDRTDPEQSIIGGARYLGNLYRRLPKGIQEPDRTWFMLAAYNVGLGHVYDARRLTESNGGNKDSWLDLREWLYKLNDKQWHKRTRYGYARGREAVEYVENIRSYYDVLQHLNREEPNAEDAKLPEAAEYSDGEQLPDQEDLPTDIKLNLPSL